MHSPVRQSALPVSSVADAAMRLRDMTAAPAALIQADKSGMYMSTLRGFIDQYRLARIATEWAFAAHSRRS
jgi:hypothetical protein